MPDNIRAKGAWKLGWLSFFNQGKFAVRPSSSYQEGKKVARLGLEGPVLNPETFLKTRVLHE